MTPRNRIIALAAVLTMGLSGAASALEVTFDIGNLPSCDGPGAPCNFLGSADLGSFLGAPGAAVQLNSVGWDLTIETFGFSWLSEAVIDFQSPLGTSLFTLTAGVGDNFAGVMSYNSGGQVDLLGALGFNPLIGDGTLWLEFYESFDDVGGAVDALYLAGSTLTLDFTLVNDVSEPGILMLVGLGLIGVAFARRRSV